MPHTISRTSARSPWFVLSLGLLVFWLAPVQIFAEEKTCGPEIKKKAVEVFEVDAEHPRTQLEDLQASEGVTWDVVATDEVHSDSSPVRRARAEAARRGCPILIVGEVRLEDSKTTVSVGGGFGGAPSARRAWSKVANVIYAEPAGTE